MLGPSFVQLSRRPDAEENDATDASLAVLIANGYARDLGEYSSSRL